MGMRASQNLGSNNDQDENLTAIDDTLYPSIRPYRKQRVLREIYSQQNNYDYDYYLQDKASDEPTRSVWYDSNKKLGFK